MKELEPLKENSCVMSCDEMSQDILGRMSENTYLVLDSLGISDRVFVDLSKKLLSKLESDDAVRSVICSFENNILTEESMPSLIRLLENDKTLYINVVSNNQISRRNIKIICSALYSNISKRPEYKEQSDEKVKEYIRKLTKKLIFIQQEYIRVASRRVLVYKDLIDKGYLVENWAEIHKNYYKNVKGMFSAQNDELKDLYYLSDSDLTDRANNLK